MDMSLLVYPAEVIAPLTAASKLKKPPRRRTHSEASNVPSPDPLEEPELLQGPRIRSVPLTPFLQRWHGLVCRLASLDIHRSRLGQLDPGRLLSLTPLASALVLAELLCRVAVNPAPGRQTFGFPPFLPLLHQALLLPRDRPTDSGGLRYDRFVPALRSRRRELCTIRLLERPAIRRGIRSEGVELDIREVLGMIQYRAYIDLSSAPSRADMPHCEIKIDDPLRVSFGPMPASIAILHNLVALDDLEMGPYGSARPFSAGDEPMQCNLMVGGLSACSRMKS